MRKKYEEWTLFGNLKNGEAIFQSTITNGFAIEKDFRDLVVPTKEEANEIRTMLGMSRNPFPNGNDL
jgi:hypothetical protein